MAVSAGEGRLARQATPTLTLTGNDHTICPLMPAMTIEQLKAATQNGIIDTVLLAIADMQGRLQGKRLTASHFIEQVLPNGAEGCNYLLAVDVEMNTVEGYAMSSWDRGYGDFVMLPDTDTLRLIPWHDATAMCLADIAWADGSDVVASPRQILRRQLARLAERGWTANAATELEFILFRDGYEEAGKKGYRDLEPANAYNVDYSLLGTARVEPLIRRIRNGMAGAGMVVENSKGECNLGQHEINFRYADALRTADEHVIYKNGAKEIAAQEEMAITFMAKYNEREGNSCHVHLSLADAEGHSVFARDRAVFERFLAGQLACLRELTLLFAPNVNSYKRFQPGSFAPTAVAWGHDNRTCSLRVVGHGVALRLENRLAGADVNPYLALSAMIAAGLHGIERELPLEPPHDGNAYVSDKPHVVTTLAAARDLFATSEIGRSAFGAEVVEHYLNNADVELRAFEAAVTDWERVRGFERL
jgi:glutamine synthetase